MAYTVIESFKLGLVKGLTRLSQPAGTLVTADNVHVTQLGELEKRQDTLMLEIYEETADETGFYGLVPTATEIYTFGTANYSEPA